MTGLLWLGLLVGGVLAGQRLAVWLVVREEARRDREAHRLASLRRQHFQ